MSVLTSPEVTPNRMRSIYNWLLVNNHEEEVETLKKLIFPTAYENKEGKSRRDQFVNPNIKELVEVGILTRSEDKVSFSEELKSYICSNDTNFQILFSNFLFGENADRNEDFIMGLAWILSIDPFNAPSDWQSFERQIKEDGCQEITGLTNNVRYGNFVIWSTFLGFSWNYQRFVPDPTEQIRWQLPHIFMEEKTLLIADFLKKLEEKVPVLNRGRFSSQLLNLKKQQSVSHLISPSLSLALKRLEDEGLLNLEKKSDINSIALSADFSRQSISHVELK